MTVSAMRDTAVHGVSMFLFAFVFVFGGLVAPRAWAADATTWTWPAPAGTSWDTSSQAYWNNAFTADEKNACTRTRPGSQSPIYLKSAFPDPRLRPLTFTYDDSRARKIGNNGHSVELEFEEAKPTLVHEGQTYSLQNLHFHYPSEHVFNGERYPMELHLVHKNAAGATLVVGVFISQGSEHAGLKPLFDAMSATAGMTNEQAAGAQKAEVKFGSGGLGSVLPPSSNRSYMTYSGSLTTPTGKDAAGKATGCTEPIRWVVFTTPIQVSAAQIQKFKKAIAYGASNVAMNARVRAEDPSRGAAMYSATARTVDLRPSPPVSQNGTFKPKPGEGGTGAPIPAGRGGGWALYSPGHIDFVFDVPQQPRNMRMSVLHATVAYWPRPGYAPVDITLVNSRGSKPIATAFDPSAEAAKANVPGNDARNYQWNTFDIPAAHLAPGSNTLRVTLLPQQRSGYWIQAIAVDEVPQVAARR